MVTYAEAQQRAEEWVNGGVPSYQRREVRVREFDLGFVAWAVDRENVHSDGGAVRMVIARDSGATTLWPALPIGDVVRRYEEVYGRPAGATPPGDRPRPGRDTAEATSFLLSPPQWLQEAGDAARAAESAGAGAPAGGGRPAGDAEGSGRPASGGPSLLVAPPVPDGPPGDVPTMLAPPPAPAVPPVPPPVPSSPAPSSPGPSAPGPSAPGPSSPGPSSPVPPPAPPVPPAAPEAHTGPLPPPVRPYGYPGPAAQPGTPGPNSGYGHPAGPGRPEGASTPPPPPAPPSTPLPAPPPAPAAGGGVEYQPTVLAQPGPVPPRPGGRDAGSAPPPPPPPDVLPSSGPLGPRGSHGGRDSGSAPPPPPPPSLLGSGGPAAGEADPQAGPGAPRPPASPLDGGPGIGYVPTQLASAIPGGSAAPPVPPAPPAPPVPPAPPAPPQAPPAPPGPQAQPGVPQIGSGYMAVLRYRASDGSEQQLIKRSAPGLPHPEWQILHELRGLGVPPEQVLELHTELECCDHPAGYCARMAKEAWPSVRMTHTAPYGRDRAARQQGVRHLLEHQGEMQALAAAPARSVPRRAPLPPPGSVPPAAPVPPQALARELAEAFGPQAVFRYDQRAVSRQGVPDAVAQSLVWAGLPAEFPPFFWAHIQPDQPIQTLQEVAAARGVQPAPDANTYLVLGNDYGRQLCVQYGTAAVVAVDMGTPALPAGPEQQQPRFVNTGLPEFVRSLALLGRMWRFRYGLTPEQAGHWTTDFQNQLLAVDPAALADPETWWSVLLEEMWDGLL